MKKIVLMVAVMMMAAPAMADMVFAISQPNPTDGTFTISYSSDVAPRGVAIRVEVTGANITGSNTQLAAFNANIDYLYDNPGQGLGDGHGLAKDGLPGEFVSGNIAIVSCGVLDTGGGQGAGPLTSDPDGLITIQTDLAPGGAATVTLTADGLRGPPSGVVGSVIASNLDDADPAITDVTIDGPIEDPPCFPAAHPDYDQWVAMGVLIGRIDGKGPECWCGEEVSPDVWISRHCYGDADASIQGYTFTGYEYVGTNDLAVLANAWGTLEPDNVTWGPVGDGIATIDSGGIPGICADFDHAKQGYTFTGYEYVGTNDLALLANSWGTLEPNPVTWGPTGPGIPGDCLDVP